MIEKHFTIKTPSAATVGVFLRNTVAALVVALTIMGVVLFGKVNNESTLAAQAAHKAVAQAEVAQRRSGQATCKALVQLDNVKNGINFSPPTKTGTAELYVVRYTQALHHLVVVTGCEKQ